VVDERRGTAGSSFALDTLAEMAPAQQEAMALRLLDSRFDDEWLKSHPRDRMLVEARRDDDGQSPR
jgi:hypothetical protein